jgi:hypothetical protein
MADPGLPRPHVHQLGGATALTVQTTTEQLIAYHKRMRTPRFMGVFASDELPRNPVGSALICNYDPSDRPGSHWVAMDFRGRGRADYFDSFGKAPGADNGVLHDKAPFADYMKRHAIAAGAPGVWHNSEDWQAYGDDQCGVWASFFLRFGRPRDEGRWADGVNPAWARFVSNGGDKRANDVAVQDWWNRGGTRPPTAAS